MVLLAKTESSDVVYIVEHKLHKIAVPFIYAFHNQEEADAAVLEKSKNPYTVYCTVKRYEREQR